MRHRPQLLAALALLACVAAAPTTLPSDYAKVAAENQSVTFAAPTDLAYGANGFYAYKSGYTGTIVFGNAAFGDPAIGVRKSGYARPVVAVQAATLPTTAPATQPGTIVRTLADCRVAIAAGATRLIAKTTITIANGDVLDLKGATLAQPSETVEGTSLVLVVGKGGVVNGTVATLPANVAIYTVVDRQKQTGVTLGGVTLAPGSGWFVLNNIGGSVTIADCHATTYSAYWYFGAAGSYVHATDCTSLGGSAGESTFRVGAGRYLLERCTFDQTAPGNSKTAAIRGDAPAYADGTPGGTVINCTITGNVTPGPLGGDDGGQNLGIDRFIVNGTEMKLANATSDRAVNAIRVAKALAQTPLLLAAGKTPAEIVAANAGTLQVDVGGTLAARASAIALRSKIQFVDCSILGDVRYVSRGDTTFARCKVAAGPTGIVLSGEGAYPQDAPRRLSLAEVTTAGSMLFDACTVTGKQLIPGLPITFKAATSQPVVSVLDRLSANATVDARNHNVVAPYAGAIACYCDTQQPMTMSEGQFRAYLRSLPKMPAYQIDAEYDWGDPASIAAANAYVTQRAAIVRQEWPGTLVTWYGGPGGVWLWVNNDVVQITTLQKTDDALAPAYAACDYVTVFGYLYKGNEPPATEAAQLDGERKMITGGIIEGIRIAKGKPVYIQYMPRGDKSSEMISATRASHAIALAHQLGAGVSMWDDRDPANAMGDQMCAMALANSSDATATINATTPDGGIGARMLSRLVAQRSKS